MSSVAELYDRRELLWNLTLRELRGRYKRSVIGWGWSLLNPIAFMLIYWFAFSIVIQLDPAAGDPSGLESYPLFLMCAFLPWTFFTNSVTEAMESVTANAALVRKVAFPREHLVTSVVLAGLFTLAAEFVVLAVALALAGNIVILWLPVLLVLTALLAIFSTGLGLALATGNVYFRDLGYLWTLGTQVLFFLTPIVYPPRLMVDRFGEGALLTRVYNGLPMAVVVRMFRNVLYDMRMPSGGDFMLLTAYAVLMFFGGWWLFNRYEGRFAEEL